MTRRRTTEWLVIIPLQREEVEASPSEGVVLFAEIFRFGDIYHQMSRQPNHTLSVNPKGMKQVQGVEMVPQNVIALEESAAMKTGAARCTECCPWT